AVPVYCMIGMLVMIVFLQIRHFRLKDIQKVLRDILFYLVVIGETALLISIIYVFADNSAPKPTIDFSARILPSTRWVKDDFPVYFISQNEFIRIRPDGSDRTIVFKADQPIRSYQFSADGQDVLIVTESELYLYHL